ncbi:MAG: FRG domain protein [Planctomycetes bacterium ADurb.Bin126]|nr:MAG: FRG domain protein [Planctomycetes bacterium ADurb.Bin126]HOD80683.1 FRG domain-containing protein [Phycisphaerae bacterium]HQL73019.1 FRG domain-containing protein [Phycisphaerae bacterium]
MTMSGDQNPDGAHAKDLHSWEELASELTAIRNEYPRALILYRGQPDSNWSLETTLDRFMREELSSSKPVKPVGLKEYLRYCLKCSPHIESVTGRSWELPEKVPSVTTLKKRLNSSEIPWLEYLAYLRHHGFPSPLLDWTRSPYIAAFFAFAKVSLECKRVAVFCYIEYPRGSKTWDLDLQEPRIVCTSPYYCTHQRHFLQKSTYTCAVLWNSLAKRLEFAGYGEIIAGNSPDQDRVIKLTIPANERTSALESLHWDHNVTEFNLFGTEESLLASLAWDERRALLQMPSKQPSSPPDEGPSHPHGHI